MRNRASDFTVGERTGLVAAAADLSAGEYDFTLRLAYEGLTASRPLRLSVAASDLGRRALNKFVKEIEAGRVNWQGGNLDWDGDGVLNPYDWTPTSVTVGGAIVSVNLTLDGASGEAGSPWPIYNVWQLQAIDGMSVSANGSMSGGLTLFGETDGVRLSAHYRLSVDIDATPTKEWKTSSGNTVGFNPIGGVFCGRF